MKDNSLTNDWLYTISPKKKIFSLNFKEIWSYRDLLFLFVKRDVITLYKQTVIGPLWYLIQPLFTSIIFTLVFNNIANINPGEGVPSFLFNLAGVTAWNYFSACLSGTSDSFRSNQGIFSKVYFPRVISPLSIVITNLIKFLIQLGLFFSFYIYFYFYTDTTVSINSTIVFMPILIFCMGFTGLGLGMIISSLTTKYRDFSFLIGFGVQLLMYGSAVVYPLETIREAVRKGTIPEYAGLMVEYNPMSVIIESFRYMMFSSGTFSAVNLIYIVISATVLFLLGLTIFNRTEKTFIDTI